MEILITDIVIITATAILLQVDIGMVYLLHHLRKSEDQLGKDLEMIIGQIPDFHPDPHRRQIIDMMGQGTGVEMVAETVVGMASVVTATDQHLVILIGHQEAEAVHRISTPTYPVTDLIAVDLQGKGMIGHVRIEDREKTGREGMNVRIVGTTETETAVDSTTMSEAAVDEHAAGVEVQSETAIETEEPESVNLWIEIENANGSVTSTADKFGCQIWEFRGTMWMETRRWLAGLVGVRISRICNSTGDWLGFHLLGLRALVGMAFGGLAVAISAIVATVRDRLLADDMINLRINGRCCLSVYLYHFSDLVRCCMLT